MKGFDRPSLFDELDGQVFEQFGMGWGFSKFPEVIRGTDESATEMVVPDPIDHHAGRQWVFVRGDGIGKFQSTASLGECGRGLIAENAQEPARCELTSIGWVSTHHDLEIRGVRFSDDMGHRIDRWRFATEGFEFAALGA